MIWGISIPTASHCTVGVVYLHKVRLLKIEVVILVERCAAALLRPQPPINTLPARDKLWPCESLKGRNGFFEPHSTPVARFSKPRARYCHLLSLFCDRFCF